MAISGVEKPQLGQILIAQQALSATQVLQTQEAQGRTLLPFGSTAIEEGLATEAQVCAALAEQWGAPAVVLSASAIDTQSLTIIPENIALGHHVLPLGSTESALKIAIANPKDQALIDEIAFASGRSVLAYVAPRMCLDAAIQAAYQARGEGLSLWLGAECSQTEAHLEEVHPAPAKEELEPEMPHNFEGFAVKPKAELSRRRDKPRVLAVDDEPEILDIIEKALGHRGMEVVKATRGRQALECLQSSMPDVVLLDAMLPEIHGFEICNKIKKSQQYQHIPVIIISAIYTGWNFIQDVKRIYGADDYIAKPFRVMEMVRRVEEFLAKAEVRPESPDVQHAHQEAEKALRMAQESLKGGRLKDSLQAAEQAVHADPFDARAHFVLGTALHRNGRIYEAISVYERVIELEPGQFSALKNLAVLYERQGFKAKAVEMWMRAMEHSPSEPVRQTIKAHLIGLL